MTEYCIKCHHTTSNPCTLLATSPENRIEWRYTVCWDCLERVALFIEERDDEWPSWPGKNERERARRGEG